MVGTHRHLDGTLSDTLVEESVCLLLRADWFDSEKFVKYRKGKRAASSGAQAKRATRGLSSDEVLRKGSKAVQVFQKWVEACRLVRFICEQLRGEAAGTRERKLEEARQKAREELQEQEHAPQLGQVERQGHPHRCFPHSRAPTEWGQRALSERLVFATVRLGD